MSTVNTHPLSSMLTRNLRIFENIKWQLSKSVAREINAHEKFVLESTGPQNTQLLFSERDFKINDV
jgi:hypothetical protein